MSSIDNPNIIRRRAAFHIWEYVTGFGGTCYKLIYRKQEDLYRSPYARLDYGLYPNGMDEREASARFCATANIQPGTSPVLIFKDGELTEKGKKWWEETFGERHGD